MFYLPACAAEKMVGEISSKLSGGFLLNKVKGRHVVDTLKARFFDTCFVLLLGFGWAYCIGCLSNSIGLYILIGLEIYVVFINPSKIRRFFKKIGLVFTNTEVFCRI